MTTKWYQNRKFLTPILAAIATLIVAILANYAPLPFTDSQLAELLGAAWFLVVGLIAGGDVAYDLLGQIARIVAEIIEARQQPPAQG